MNMPITLDFDDMLQGQEDFTVPYEVVRMNKDLAERKLIINKEIDNDMVEYADYIQQWNLEDKDTPIENRKPIKIFINSNGGDPNMALYLVDTINASDTPVYTVGMSACCSAALYILLAGHKRFMFQNAFAVIHDGSILIENVFAKGKDQFNFFEIMHKKQDELIRSRTKIKQKDLDKNFRNDWFIVAEDCLKFGIVDKIIKNLREVF